MYLDPRADRIYEIIKLSPGKRMKTEEVRKSVALQEKIALDLFPTPTCNATVRSDCRTRQKQGRPKRFRHFGDGNEERGYLSIIEGIDENRDTVPSKQRYESEISSSPITITKKPSMMTISQRILEQIDSAIGVALAYEEATNGNRKLPITGEVGEILTCKILSLCLATDFQSAGIDAWDADGKSVQIKTRREAADKPSGDHVRIGRFSEHPFDYAILAILNKNFQLKELWRAEYEDVISIVKDAPKRNPNLYLFKRIAKKIYG